MYKLLIVDDEYIVRQGLRKILPWNELGVVVAGEAGTVEEALQTASAVYPDIVICDIQLPGGEGFDMIETMRKQVPWVQFIMITAYSEQKYLLKAINSEVCDYLFKPAGIEQIKAAVRKAAGKIDRIHEKEQKNQKYRDIMMQSLGVLREYILNAEETLYVSPEEEQIPALPEPMSAFPESRNEEWGEDEYKQLKQRRNQIFEAIKYHDSIEEILKLFDEYQEALEGSGLSDRRKNDRFCSIVETTEVLSGVSLGEEYRYADPKERRAIFERLCRRIQKEKKYFGDISEKALYMIRKRYREDISLEQIAAELFLSSSYLSRTIKERTGKGFQRWLNEYRITAAKEALEETDKSIEQIAEECGYHSYRIFSEQFRKYTGETATQYRFCRKKTADPE